jgi:hypothetical protein
MPFYCGKRSAGICVVLDPKKSSTYSSEYASGFFSSLRPCICPHLLCLVTKDYSDRLLGMGTSWIEKERLSEQCVRTPTAGLIK